MQTTFHSMFTPRRLWRLIGLTWLAALTFSATMVAPALAAESDTIARPAAARDAARGEADRPEPQCKLVDDEFSLCLPMFNQEPLRELVDKYAPSAIEWSMLPHLAGRSKPLPKLREVDPV